MTKKTKLIGLTGYAGSGKDTVRDCLDDLGWHGLALADPIRLMVGEMLDSANISRKWMMNRELKEQTIPELGVSYRALAQTLGTEWGRKTVSPMLWIRMAQAYMDSTCTAARPVGGFDKFVVSDIRFANEAQWIRDQGGAIWRIERPQAVPVRAHVSEAEIYHFAADAVIVNDGTFDQLWYNVIAALEATV